MYMYEYMYYSNIFLLVTSVNLAYGREVHVSSTDSGATANVVDEDASTCFSTSSESQAYVVVQLDRSYTVSSVTLHTSPSSGYCQATLHVI